MGGKQREKKSKAGRLRLTVAGDLKDRRVLEAGGGDGWRTG